MALHPRAQVKLLKYLEQQAKSKSLTVIFSTHSVTLLKTLNRNRIIYLEKLEDGEIRPIIGCFPTYAIGNIAAEEETLPDVVLYVEDLFARDTLTAFYEKFVDERFEDPTTRPTTKIVPVGPFDAVVSFLQRNRSVLPEHVKQKAILDNDVVSESVANWRTNNNHVQLAKFQAHQGDIKYLPFTPEVGLIEHIADNLAAFEQALRSRCADNQIRIAEIVRGYDRTLTGADQRKAAKAAADEILRHLAQRTSRSIDTARENVCGVFAVSAWDEYRADIMQLLAPLM
jgi:hypothetical protein